jgi:hypothetical protein
MPDLTEVSCCADDGADGVNIRSSSYCVARAPAVCGQCGTRVTVTALVVMPGHEMLELGESPTDDCWTLAAGSAFLFFVEYVPEGVRRRLSVLAPAYRRRDGRSGGGSHWVNHCDGCGSAFDEQALFGEPGGAFVPTTAAEAARVFLTRIDADFEGAAGGYAYEPEFFGAMSAG